ncbi:MAG: acetoacetate decarboxylase family protein [Actinomycetia bacterium]|nr:acetoacetate decarboxylase family protein [Actinomycetes bacterium]
MTSPSGFLFPQSPTGRASILPSPPWHYSGEMLTIEYRTDPEKVLEVLPRPLEPAAEDPGAVALIWAEWQSCSDSGEELLDPVRSQYKECFFVVRCRYQDRTWSRCVYIWVDTDFSMVRGHHQGYPKRLGEIRMTRPVLVGRAGPRLEREGRFGATLSANGRRLAEARLTLTEPGDHAGFVNALPMLHSRRFPTIESDGTASMDELVTMRGYDIEIADGWQGDAELSLFPSPAEEHYRLIPREMIGGYWRRVGMSWKGGTTLHRSPAPPTGVAP